VELQMQQLQGSAQKLEGQARQALAQNREDLAREALTRKAAAEAELRDLQVQHDQLRNEEGRLVEASRRLEAKIQAFRTRKETIKASYTAAEAQTKVGEALSGISEEMSDVGLAMQRAEDKVAQMQARSGAVEELMASGALDDMSASSDPLQAELDQTALGSGVDADMARLRRELSSGERKALEASTDEGQ
ncbi:MAG TPA: PspA/IM30 family protein, partial [Actinomycetota bacterium]|nr:PspA/IM30 family protein [Actinomycetota bacterium]